MKKENFKRLCDKCKAIVRKEDTDNKRIYRLKIKQKSKQVSGSIPIKYDTKKSTIKSKGRR